MIKRIALGLIGVLSGAVAISAATHAVDFEDSTIEDGDARYTIAAIAAALFVICVVLLVRSLGGRRRARTMVADATRGLPTEPSPTQPTEIVATRSPSERISARAIGDAQPGRSTMTSIGSTMTKPSGLSAPGTSGNDSVFGPRPFTPMPTNSAPEGTGATRSVLFPDRGVPDRGVDRPAGEPVTPPNVDEVKPFIETSAPVTATASPSTAPSTGDTAVDVAADATADHSSSSADEPAGSADEPAGSDIHLRDYSPAEIDATIDESGRLTVEELVAAGALSSEGPLTPGDIRTMLFIALSTEQLRRILHEARSEEPLFDLGGPAPDPEALPQWFDVDGDPDNPDDENEPPSGRLYATGA